MIAIAAVSKNWVIGDSKSNKMPWHSKEDFAWFKEVTTSGKINVCICGRKTADSVGLLSKRSIWPVSRRKCSENCHCLDASIFEFIKKNRVELESLGFSYYLIGGASIYSQFLCLCEVFYLTEFDFEVEGDVSFPFGRNQLELMFPKIELVKEIARGKIWKYSK